MITRATTQSGLSVRAAHDPNWYPTGQRISDVDFATIPLAAHNWHGDWNYTIAQNQTRGAP